MVLAALILVASLSPCALGAVSETCLVEGGSQGSCSSQAPAMLQKSASSSRLEGDANSTDVQGPSNVSDAPKDSAMPALVEDANGQQDLQVASKSSDGQTQLEDEETTTTTPNETTIAEAIKALNKKVDQVDKKIDESSWRRWGWPSWHWKSFDRDLKTAIKVILLVIFIALIVFAVMMCCRESDAPHYPAAYPPPARTVAYPAVQTPYPPPGHSASRPATSPRGALLTDTALRSSGHAYESDLPPAYARSTSRGR